MNSLTYFNVEQRKMLLAKVKLLEALGITPSVSNFSFSSILNLHLCGTFCTRPSWV